MSGNLGIGTTGPGQLLEVYNGDIEVYNAGFESHVRLTNTSTNGRDYWLISGGSGGDFVGGEFGVWDNTSGAVRAYIASGVNGWQTPSDRRLKNHIQTLSVLDRLNGLRGVSYRLKDSGKPQIGVIAQEVQAEFPQAVTGGDGRGYLGVSYEAIAAIALEGVKELKAENEALAARVRRLEQAANRATPSSASAP